MRLTAYYINLDKDQERRAFMEDQCRHAGFAQVHRFAAIDTATMSPGDRYRPGRWGAYWELLPSEVALFESHRALWQQIEATGQPGVILEDDAFLSREMAATCAKLVESAAFDLVKLDGLATPMYLGPEINAGGPVMRAILAPLPSAAAYLLSPDGARQLLARSARYCDHLDDFITRPQKGYRLYQILPILAVQGMFADLSAMPDVPETIIGSARTGGAEKARPAKGPALYRLQKECRRSARKIARTFWSNRKLRAHGGLVHVPPVAPDLPLLRRQ